MYTINFQAKAGHFEPWQFILTPKDMVVGNTNCPLADALIKAAGKWSSRLHEEVYVYDLSGWKKSRQLWETVQTASWDDVILEPAMKHTLIEDVEDFLDSRSVYEEFDVP